MRNLAVADPVLMAGDPFGLRAGWGHDQERSALGISALGALDRNFLGTKTALSIG